MPPKEVTVLLVDDDEIDVDSMKRAFIKARIANPIVVASDGLQAVQMLRGTDGETKVSRPFLIMLDLNMPRMNGLEFLEEIRNDPEFESSIVFVLTTSDFDRDRWAAYKNNVAGYILKNNVGSGFTHLISLLDHYWKIIEFPEHPAKL